MQVGTSTTAVPAAAAGSPTIDATNTVTLAAIRPPLVPAYLASSMIRPLSLPTAPIELSSVHKTMWEVGKVAGKGTLAAQLAVAVRD
jgi:hypothetical protein